MTYTPAPLCDEDITNIYLRGVADFGIDRAEAYHAGLVRTFGLIASNPRLARRRVEFGPPARMHPYRTHTIVYRERDDCILIVRVLHGRQTGSGICDRSRFHHRDPREQ